MIEIREDKATAEQLLEYLESTCKSWGISGTEHQISGFVDLIAVVQIEEILVPAPYFSTSQPLFRQAVLGKIQELSWKPMEPTVGHPLAPNINGNIQVKRDNQPAKKIPNSQSNNRDSKKKGVDKSRKDTPTVKGADTMKTIEAIEKITANKVNQPRSAPTVAIAHVQTNPKTNSFLDIQVMA